MGTRVERRVPSALPCDIGWNQNLVSLKGAARREIRVSERESPEPTPSRDAARVRRYVSLEAPASRSQYLCPRAGAPGLLELPACHRHEGEERACDPYQDWHRGIRGCSFSSRDNSHWEDSLGVEGALTGGADNANILEVAAVTRR
jgi:hypothetical protein